MAVEMEVEMAEAARVEAATVAETAAAMEVGKAVVMTAGRMGAAAMAVATVAPRSPRLRSTGRREDQ